MKTKIFLVSIMVLLALFAAFLFHSILEKDKAIKTIQAECEIVSSRYSFLYSHMHIQEKASGHYLNTSLQLTNRTGNTLELSKILNDSINIILYVPLASCSSCNENIFRNLPRAITLTRGKLKIIGPAVDFNAILLFSNHTLSDQSLYAIDQPLVNRKTVNLSSPSILNITNKGQIKSIFVIDNNDIDFFNNYLQFCIKDNYIKI